MRRRLSLHHPLLLLLLGGAVAWVAHRAQGVRQDPAAVLEALRAAQGPTLPLGEEVGASHRDAVESYDPTTLYDFINGAADAYLARGFTRCVATVYAFQGEQGGTFEVGAEVYRFATPAGARAQLEAERSPVARPLPGPEETWVDGGLLLALAGSDYLKLNAYDSNPATEAAMRRLLLVWRGEEGP